MAFDISAAFGDLKPKGPIRTMITEIELHMIDPNPTNFYSMDGIPELADNIRMFGLMEPLIVKKTDSGRYMLISGHRRRAALRQLADEGFFPEGMHHKVDCILHEGPVNLPGIESLEKLEAGVRLYEELKVLAANADTRVLSSADTAMQVRRIRELLTALKNLGYKLPGRMRDLVADAAKVSASRIARLDVIDKNLKDPRLRTAWEKGDLKETNAYEVARYAPEVQKHMTDSQVRRVCELTTDQVQAFMPAVEADWEVVKRLPPEEDAEIGSNPGNVSAADTKPDPALQFDGKGKMVWDADAYLEERHQEDDSFFEMLTIIKGFFLRDLGALNSRQEGIELLKKNHRHHSGGGYDGLWDYEGSGKGLTLQETETSKPIARTWTEVYDMLCTMALNECSMETGKPKKVSAADTNLDQLEWIRGSEPPKEGRYICLVDMDTVTLHEQQCDWSDGQWIAFGLPLRDMFKVVAWWPLPAKDPSPEWWYDMDDEEEDDDDD